MKNILFVFCLMSLTLAVGAHAQAQSSSASPASAPLTKSERIALCEKKHGAPVDPSDPQPLAVGGKVIRPTVIHQVKPEAASSTPNGKVVVKAIVDEDGCVRQPEVLKSSGEAMKSAALKAFSQWVFQPVTLDGRPVRVFYVFMFNGPS